MKTKSKRRLSIHYLLIVLLTCVSLLSLMYRDVLTALDTYHPYTASLTQSTKDDYLQKLHVTPILGGGDLDPPYAIAASVAREALVLPPDQHQEQQHQEQQQQQQQQQVDVEIALEPDFGSHRFDQDAVFAIVNTMEYDEIVLFVTTLRQSGFTGDVVLSANIYFTSQEIKKNAQWQQQQQQGSYTPQLNKVGKLLRYYCTRSVGIVVYGGVVRNSVTHDTFSNTMDVEKDYVYLRGLYRIKDTQDIMEDERIPRSLGVARFELYWVWSKKYSPSSTILLIDAQDSYFQMGAFHGMGSNRVCRHSNATSTLHTYEENSKNKTHRLTHAQNMTMLVASYKVFEITRFTYNDNVLSAASTHGDQRAIEAYLRAMVKQFDYTQCALYRCEWAFHNYLYYMGVLWSLPEIDQVKVYMHGTGAVNSVGKDVPLTSSPRIYDSESYTVLNLPMGHGVHPSWCVHQYKLDEELYGYINETKKKLVKEIDYNEPPVFWNGGELLGMNYTVSISPLIGKHRPEQDAIFSIFYGTNVNDIALFVLSARKVGFQGDIVLSTPDLNKLASETSQLLSTLAKKKGVILYTGLMQQKGDQWILPNFFKDPTTGNPISDPRPPRAKSVLAFEIFREWTNYYASSSKIMITDAELTFFQGNPFVNETSCRFFELHLHYEHAGYRKFGSFEKQDVMIANAIEAVFDAEDLSNLATRPLLNPNAVHGHQDSIKIFISDMISGFDSFQCYHFGCNWAVLNYIWYSRTISNYESVSYEIFAHKQGGGYIIHVTVPPLDFMTERGLFDPSKMQFKSWKGTVSPVVFRYKFSELEVHFQQITRQLLSELDYATGETNVTGDES